MDSFLEIKALLNKQFEPFFREEISPQLEAPEVDAVLSYSFIDGPSLELVIPKELISAYYRNKEITPFADIVMEGYERSELGLEGEVVQVAHTKGENHILVTRHGSHCRTVSIYNGLAYDLSCFMHVSGSVTFSASKVLVGNFDINYEKYENYIQGVARSGARLLNLTEQILNEPNFLKPLVDAIKLLENART